MPDSATPTTPRAFFEQLLATPSPSGFEEPIVRVGRDYLKSTVPDCSVDVHGNLTAVTGDADGPRLMLAGHCDQIGMIVSHIDEEGFVYAQTIGGWDPQQLIGQSMTIWTDDGPVPALISRKPIHLLDQKERQQVVKIEQMWLDIGASTGKEARSMVQIGDPVTLHLQLHQLAGERMCSPAMDNKTGMWTVLETARRCAEQSADNPLRCELHAVADGC